MRDKSFWRSVVVGFIVGLLGMLLQMLWPNLELYWTFVLGSAIGNVIREIVSRVYK